MSMGLSNLSLKILRFRPCCDSLNLTRRYDRALRKPPRSACVFCPYHNDAEWQRMKTQEPAEFAKAVEWEKRFTKAASRTDTLKGTPYLHSSLVPLSEVQFNPDKTRDLFQAECEGMCGV